MTYEEAKLKNIEYLKIDIRNRLHKYNPSKYPKPKMYSATDAIEVSFALAFLNQNIKNLFERDDIFYKHLKKK